MNIKISAQVDNVVYQFELDGRVTSRVDLYPPVLLPDGNMLTTINTDEIDNAPHSLGSGDVVSIDVSDDTVIVSLLESNNTCKLPVKAHVCPSCGLELVYDSQGNKYCLNRACPAQRSNNIFSFIEATGLVLDISSQYILDSLLCRGAIDTPCTLFTISIEELLAIPSVTPATASAFIQTIHSIRNNTLGISALLRTLRIPGWDYTQYNRIEQYSIENNYALKDSSILVDPNHRSKINVDWIAFDSLMNIGINRHLFFKLADLLAS